MVFEGINLKITRNVQAAHMNVPGFGILHLYNTHLCSACSIEALRRLVDGLLGFVQQVEAVTSNNHAVIGGDFNLDSVKGAAEQSVYEAIMKMVFETVTQSIGKPSFPRSQEPSAEMEYRTSTARMESAPYKDLLIGKQEAASQSLPELTICSSVARTPWTQVQLSSTPATR